MAEIINLQQYKIMKEEEQKQLKIVSILSNKQEHINGLLHGLNECIGASFVIKCLGEANKLMGKEYPIDEDLFSVIIDALSEYEKTLSEKIDKINRSL